MNAAPLSSRLSRLDPSPQVVDRVLLGACAVIWLMMLGASVAATVALVDLGRGFHQSQKAAHSGWLYIVIGVSALIILAAVPLWLRLRSPGANAAPAVTRAEPTHRHTAAPKAGFDAPGRRAAGTRAALPNQTQVDQVLQRGITALATALGGALTMVALATYLMAVGKTTGSWVCYGLAAAVTVATPAIPWLYLRRLGEVLELPSRFG